MRAGIGWLSVCLAAAAISGPAYAQYLDAQSVRAEITGRKLTGYYADGRPWTETYFADTSINYQDQQYTWSGAWSFRGTAFCTFYNRGANGGCWQVRKISSNCYEFHISSGEPSLAPSPALPHLGSRHWTARGWRTEAVSTCGEWAGS